jgi:hypothetical protein
LTKAKSFLMDERDMAISSPIAALKGAIESFTA